MKLGDRAIGLLTALGGLALINASLGFGTPSGQPVGAGFFPVLIGGVLVAAGLGLAALEQRRVGRGEGVPAWIAPPDFFATRQALAGVILLVAAIVFFILAVTSLGFVPTAALIVVAVATMLGMRLPWAVLTGLAIAVGFQLLFVKLLRVALPPGLLAGLI